MNVASLPSQAKKDSTGAPRLGFFGEDLDLDLAETLLCTRWDDRQRAAEPALFATKDWDERVRHPVISTYYFCHLFVTETRLIIRAHVDNTPARVGVNGRVIDWNPIKSGDPLEPPNGERAIKTWRRKLGSLIRARQWADEHGIPYQFMIRVALKRIYFGRHYLLQRSPLPDPGLLNGEQMREQVILAWVDQLEAKIQHGTHPRYLLVNGDKHPDVVKHQVWILQQAKRRGQPQFALANFIKQGLLDPKLVALAFPNHIAQALRLAQR